MPNLPDYPAEVARLNLALDRFCGLPLPNQDGPALATLLQHVQGASYRLAFMSSQASAAFADTDHPDNLGFVSPLQWMRVNLHLTSGAAIDRIAVGQQLAKIPESHQSLLEGEIGYAHLAHIARTAAAIEESGTNPPLDEMARLEKVRARA